MLSKERGKITWQSKKMKKQVRGISMVRTK